MRQVIDVVVVVVASGVLLWCAWVLWSVWWDLRELGAADRRLTTARRDTRAAPVPDAEIDYDYVSLADLRRMSDEQLRRGYEHALKREARP